MEDKLIKQFEKILKDEDLTKLELSNRDIKRIIMCLYAENAYTDKLDKFLGLKEEV